MDAFGDVPPYWEGELVPIAIDNSGDDAVYHMVEVRLTPLFLNEFVKFLRPWFSKIPCIAERV